MTIVFKHKGEQLSFGAMYELESPFVKYCLFVLEDADTGDKIEMKVLPGQLKSGDVEEAKGLEPLVGRIIYKVDSYLREKIPFHDLLGWDKDVCWNWSGSFSEDYLEPLVVELKDFEKEELSLEVDPGESNKKGRISFQYIVKSKSRKSGKKTVDENVSLSKVGLLEKAFAVFDIKEIKQELERVSREEGRAGRIAFLSAISRLGDDSDFSLLHDFAKAKFAHAISARHNHDITDEAAALEVIKGMKLFLSKDVDLLSGISVHDTIY
ncbi:hypothetical protein QC820_09960 [Halomonas mongoliensis]|uniref:Uncharacterized protein n=1 Tax=Halomonas mongoliensis TaxID=321265 RepID=A0ABU1GM87_9GAMM|nr:hypothetical protein [Halomonas mongoliensis]MDR5893141.1 hypothetical protein [Halomonas mongoliensis]